MIPGTRLALAAAALAFVAEAAGQNATPPAPANAPAAEPAPPRVELFSPRGQAKQVRQVTARFSTPMVALGDPRLADPFTVSCEEPGKGRWADGRNWVYDFEADLPAGVSCSFRLRTGLSALDGRALTGTTTFS